MRGTVNANARQIAMRKLLTALAGDPDFWQLIGRELYRSGTYGTFKMEIDNGGTHSSVAGLIGTYTSNEGATDRISFRFADLLVSTNPTNNPNYRGESCCADEGDWDWHIARPESLVPLHAAIDAWVMMWELRNKDIVEMERDASKTRRRP